MRVTSLLLSSLLVATACSTPNVRFERSAVGVAIHAPDGLFAELRTDGRRGPVLWPLCAPGGATITRAYPLCEIEGERRDHPHHESCWFTHGKVDGVDFWAGDGGVIPVGEPVIDASAATLVQRAEWRKAGGEVVCRDVRELRFAADADTRTIDVAVCVEANADRALRFGDTKEGTMALRLRNEFCLDGPEAAGAMQNSEGVTGKPVWGKRARWVAYSAALDGVEHTVAMFDAPDNHGHPTYWHARGYGLFAANPFGLHDFVRAPKGTGDLEIPAGGALRLRYRIWIRRGAVAAEVIDAAWRAFANPR
ncbi:MAG: PmoA family protein [bacterium]|nr:PmoA family protein [bacterium]